MSLSTLLTTRADLKRIKIIVSFGKVSVQQKATAWEGKCTTKRLPSRPKCHPLLYILCPISPVDQYITFLRVQRPKFYRFWHDVNSTSVKGPCAARRRSVSPLPPQVKVTQAWDIRPISISLTYKLYSQC